VLFFIILVMLVILCVELMYSLNSESSTVNVESFYYHAENFGILQASSGQVWSSI